MKKIFSTVLGLCLSICLFAQTSSIALFVYAPEQPENVPTSSVDYLVNSLCNAVTVDGLAAQNEYMTQFLLVPKINVATKNILANTQQQVVLTLDVTLQVIDNYNGTIYASQSVNLKGVGTNEIKAYNSAFRSLNKNNSRIQSLASTAKHKIISYYESESANIIKRAQLLATQEKYDEAFYMLSMIPSQCSKYDAAISAGLDVWKKYRDYSCAVNMGKARSAWVANQDIDGANIAGLYLSEIFPDASCYGDAMQLYKDIKSRVGELWKFEMKQYETESDLRLAKVKAMQAIGVAYGKGQQPRLVIHKSMF